MDPIRVVFVGDIHKAPGPRSADRDATVDQIIDYGSDPEHRADLWIWLGDIFEGASTPEDRNAIDRRVRWCADVAPVVILYGNHDKPRDLHGFANLAGRYPITVVDAPTSLNVTLADETVAVVACLPYAHKGQLVGAGVAPGAIVETAGHLLDPIFMQLTDAIESARHAACPSLFVFHANIAGAITSAGQPNVGQEIELSHEQLARLGPICKVGGHIHRPQEIAGAYYAGSTSRKDYGEIEPKRFLVATIAADSSYDLESHPIDCPPMYHIDAVFQVHAGASCVSLCDGADEDVRRRWYAEDWTGCDVRVRYEYRASERAAVDESIIRKLFAAALRLKVEGVVVPDRELRAPEVAIAKTLHDKLAAMRPERTLPATLGDKVALLEQQDGAAVLAQVRAWLTSIETPENEMVGV